MRVLVPTTVQPSNYLTALQDSNYGYTNSGDYATSPVWSSAAAYAIGDKVIVESSYSIYQCIVAHTNHAPPTPPLTSNTWWVRISASNAWKPFDALVNTNRFAGYDSAPSQSAGFSRFRLVGMGAFDSVAILNADVSWIHATYTAVGNFALPEYERYIYCLDDSLVFDAWEYCFGDLPYRNNYVFDGIDGWGTGITGDAPTLSLEAVNFQSLGTVRIGEILVGPSYDLGKCHSGAKMSLVDYSVKTVDAYGNLSIVSRSYSFNATFEIEVPSLRRSRVTQLIADLRATPCVFYPTSDDANDGIIIYGVIKSFDMIFETPERAYFSLEVEGLA